MPTPPDLAAAAKAAFGAIFRNAGQVCVAGSRLLVVATEAMVAGNPLALTTQVGAVNSLPQLDANLRFVADARAECGQVLTGGIRLHQDTGGYYMAPTIVGGVQPGHRLFRDEVFGPVLAVTPFETEAEALHLANATDDGQPPGSGPRTCRARTG